MTGILTWNIQCGLGVDGRIDLPRIARVIGEMGDPDVICLQEVARHMPPYDTGANPDQVAELAGLFPNHQPFFGAAVDRLGDAGGPRQSFGNLILSRLPVALVFHHELPQPAENGLRHMPRQAIETTILTAGGPLRLVTTHLEYHSLAQRKAQVARLMELHSEACANVDAPPEQDAPGPYTPAPRPKSCVICGDFNFETDGPEYRAITHQWGDDTGTSRFVDAWPQQHGDRPHDPTCGIFDTDQWPAGPHCRDFFFVTEDVADRLARIEVNTETDASDHQPVLLALEE